VLRRCEARYSGDAGDAVLAKGGAFIASAVRGNPGLASVAAVSELQCFPRLPRRCAPLRDTRDRSAASSDEKHHLSVTSDPAVVSDQTHRFAQRLRHQQPIKGGLVTSPGSSFIAAACSGSTASRRYGGITHGESSSDASLPETGMPPRPRLGLMLISPAITALTRIVLPGARINSRWLRNRCAKTLCSPAHWKLSTKLTPSPKSLASNSAKATTANTAATTEA
jgi:hypothetical protein